MTKIFEISNFSDIESLWKFSQPETMNLEFKQDLSKDGKEIAKDISSFANSEGGVIIYGIEEENERAKESNGMKIGGNAEKIQQIVSSSIAPPLPIEIISVNVKQDDLSINEFLVVKIPKSPFMIHQVTTTSKFYVRNNTTTNQHKFESFEMKENEIALRYEHRFSLKQEQTASIETKENQIANTVGWQSYFLISVLPHVQIPDSLNITPDYYKKLFMTNDSWVIYNDIPESSGRSIPNYDGRSSDPFNIEKAYFEINNSRSIHFCRKISSDANISMYTPMFVVGSLIHLANRIFQESGYYGGSTFRLAVNGSITTDTNVDHNHLPNGGRTVSDFIIHHEMNRFPIQINNEYQKIFQKYFEALHIDNAVHIFRDSTIQRVFAGLEASDARLTKSNTA